jgi:glycosyltransferase involved in cell wall biosynthesis
MPPARWFENRTRSYANKCVEVIQREQAALAEIHNRPHILRLIAREVQCKLALHLHNDPQEMDDARTPTERRKLLAKCDGIYCVSDYIRNRFLEGLQNDARTKLHVVHNGIEIPATLPAKEKLIVFAGRMTEDKGALPLAEALRIALPKLPDWRAVLVGSRRFAVSENLSSYENQVAETLSPLGAQVTLTGFIPHAETLHYFAGSSIAVVPSLWQEPFGRTALEALAYGAAVISSGRGGLREVTGEAALTVDNVTPQTLANAILMLARNTHERERLQHLARIRATHFSIAQCTQTLDDARSFILGESTLHAA